MFHYRTIFFYLQIYIYIYIIYLSHEDLPSSRQNINIFDILYRKIQLQTYLYNYTRKYIEFFSTILRVILIYYLNNIIIITLLYHLLININFKLHIYVSLSESLHSYPLSSFHVQLNARIEIYFLHLIV